MSSNSKQFSSCRLFNCAFKTCEAKTCEAKNQKAKKNFFFYQHYENTLKICIVPVLCTLWACSIFSHSFVIKWIIAIAVVIAAVSIVSAHGGLTGITHSLRIHTTVIVLLFTAFISVLCIHIPFALQKSQQFFGMPPALVSRVSGTVLEDSRPNVYGGSRTTLSLEHVMDRYGTKVEARGPIVLYFDGPPPNLYRGQHIRAVVQLRQRQEKTNAESNGKCYASGVDRPIVEGFSSPVLKSRCAVLSTLKSKLRSIGTGAPPLLEALLLGYKNSRSHRLCDLFQRAGCAHLLALSGMHLGVLSMGVLVCAIPLFGRKKALVLSLGITISYLFLVGVRASMLRAVLMYALGTAGFLFFNVKPNPLHILSVTFILQTCMCPEEASGLGFQLSYAALTGICLWTKAVARCLPRFVPPVIRETCAATIAAQCSTAWILVKSFGVIYPSGLLAPLFLTPLVMIWMWSGLTYIGWTVLLSYTASPCLFVWDRMLRLALEVAASVTMKAVHWWSYIPEIEIPSEKWGVTALISVSILTIFSICQYAGRYGRRIKLQLSKLDRTISSGEWNGPNPPIWSELPYLESGPRENNKAA